MKVKLIIFQIIVLFIIGCKSVSMPSDIATNTNLINNTDVKEKILNQDKIQLNISKIVNETGRKHAIVKLESNQNKSYLKELGITFLSEGKEDHTWWVSIPIKKIEELSKITSVFWVKEIDSNDKIYLPNYNQLPIYVRNEDGTLNLRINCFKDVDQDYCIKVIKTYGSNITQISKNSFAVFNVDNSSLFNLANNDIIATIEGIDGPTEPTQLDVNENES